MLILLLGNTRGPEIKIAIFDSLRQCISAKPAAVAFYRLTATPHAKAACFDTAYIVRPHRRPADLGRRLK